MSCPKLQDEWAGWSCLLPKLTCMFGLIGVRDMWDIALAWELIDESGRANTFSALTLELK